MKRTLKTIGTIGVMTMLLLSAYWFGTTQAQTITEVQTVTEVKEVVPDGYIDTNSDEFINNYVDMRKVTYFEVVDGLQLYMEDGSGYYWE